MFLTTLEAKGEGWDSEKLALAAVGTFIVILLVNCYVVVQFQMYFF